jgi:hypothetical protein
MTSLDNMTDLLDAQLDDLEDLPEFKPFNPGAHQLIATFAEKTINDKAAVELTLKLVETIELSDPQQEFDAPGTECSMAFFLDNEFARGNLKKVAKPFGAALGLGTIREIVEGVKNVECLALTTLRKDKNDPDRFYLNIKEIQVT